jgi:hypothetical protein
MPVWLELSTCFWLENQPIAPTPYRFLQRIPNEHQIYMLQDAITKKSHRFYERGGFEGFKNKKVKAD